MGHEILAIQHGPAGSPRSTWRQAIMKGNAPSSFFETPLILPVIKESPIYRWCFEINTSIYSSEKGDCHCVIACHCHVWWSEARYRVVVSACWNLRFRFQIRRLQWSTTPACWPGPWSIFRDGWDLLFIPLVIWNHMVFPEFWSIPIVHHSPISHYTPIVS